MRRTGDDIGAVPTRTSRLAASLRAIVGVALVGVIATRVDLRNATQHSWRDVLAGTLAAILLLLLAQLLSAARWRSVLRRPDMPLEYLFRLYLVGQFFGLFLPTSVGGDAVRALSLARTTGQPTTALASVLLDRLLGLAALMLLLACGVAVSGTTGLGALGIEWLPATNKRATASTAVALTGLALSGAIGAALIWRRVSPRWGAGLRLTELRGLVRRPALGWAWLLLLSVLVQGIYVATWWALVAALRLPVPSSFLLLAVPLVSLAAMLPVTISGLGVREGAWIALLAAVGVGGASALTSSLLYFAAFAVVGALGGLWFAVAGLVPRHADRTVPAGTSVRSEGELA